MTPAKFFLPLTLSLMISAPAQAEDPDSGRALHNQQCTSCHGSEVYTRPDRRVDSLAALQTQVDRCTSNLGVQWFDDQTAAVVEYLNQSYYKF